MNQFLHTMIRVNNLDESLKFYVDALGMKLLRKRDYPNGEFTLAFVGYGDEKTATVVELTHNWGTSSYEQGTAFGHLAIGVDDIYGTCGKLKEQWRQSRARAGSDEVWWSRNRFYRRSQRLQNRADSTRHALAESGPPTTETPRSDQHGAIRS